MGAARRAGCRLYRRARSPFLWADFTLDGRRHRESTGTLTEREARAWVETRKRDLLAERIREEERARLGQPTSTVALGTFCRVYWFAHIRIRMKTRRDARRESARLIAFARWYGPDKPLAGVNDAVIGKYQADFLAGISQATKRKRKPGTWNRAVQRIRHALGWAFAKGFITAAPVRRWPMLHEPKTRPLHLTPEGYERLLAVAPPRIKPAMILAAETGARLGEIEGCLRADVDLTAVPPRVTWRNTKAGEDRQVPLSPAALEVVKALDRDRPAGCKTLLYQADGAPWHDHKRNRQRWAGALAAAGIAPETRWHDLRGYFATRKAEEGVPETVVMALGGWKTPAVSRRYRRVRWAEQVKAMGWDSGSKVAHSWHTGAPERCGEKPLVPASGEAQSG